MDTGFRQLINFPSLRISRNSSNSNASWRETTSFVEDHHDLRYISLKDIILNSSSPTCYSTNLLEGGSDFINSSNISIRNELVKRAASAYIQSSTILNVALTSKFVKSANNPLLERRGEVLMSGSASNS
ncbi:hypothetical protein Dsin_018667 [Dipteronia sinensis]|uniref:Uncharacterized protein n=1 Tax=Dipteronia sinensis TaxID=43782 RepID=A0AAE0A5X0_9ROSI|nr:hypothetical protein Dsin_018667 [Dipteronia sinensis]